MSVEISEMLGKKIVKIEGLEKYSEELKIHTADFHCYRFWHPQDCCESVLLEDWDGDPEDLLGLELTTAEETTNSGEGGDYESYTWTFYRLGTRRGMVTLRFLGHSNGYYSEEVTIDDLSTPESRAEAHKRSLERELPEAQKTTHKRTRL